MIGIYSSNWVKMSPKSYTDYRFFILMRKKLDKCFDKP